LDVSRSKIKSDRFDPANRDEADSSDNHRPTTLFGTKFLESSDHAGLESAKLG
jgi:hypothetical protein